MKVIDTGQPYRLGDGPGEVVVGVGPGVAAKGAGPDAVAAGRLGPM